MVSRACGWCAVVCSLMEVTEMDDLPKNNLLVVMPA